MIQSKPIDIPVSSYYKNKSIIPRRNHIICATLSKTKFSKSQDSIILSGISLSPKNNSLSEHYDSIITIEMLSPITDYDKYFTILNDIFSVSHSDDIDYILYRLDRVKLAKIQCKSLTKANIACSLLNANGINAWIQ
jgi:hypothetical protein